MIGGKIYGTSARHTPHFRTIIHEVTVDFRNGFPSVNDNDCIIFPIAQDVYSFNLVKNIAKVLYIGHNYQLNSPPSSFDVITMGAHTIGDRNLGDGNGTHKCISFDFALRSCANGQIRPLAGIVHFQIIMQQNEAQ